MTTVIKPYLRNELFEGIVGKSEYIKLYTEDFIDTSNTVLISIHDPDSQKFNDDMVSRFQDSIQVQFWDIEETIGKYEIISDEIAEELREFINKNKDRRFFIHCHAGQSRSAGVGMAVECIVKYNGNKYDYSIGGGDITSHNRYSPNMVVYDKIIGG